MNEAAPMMDTKAKQRAWRAEQQHKKTQHQHESADPVAIATRKAESEQRIQYNIATSDAETHKKRVTQLHCHASSRSNM